MEIKLMGLPVPGDKSNFNDMFSRFDTIAERDRRTYKHLPTAKFAR